MRSKTSTVKRFLRFIFLVPITVCAVIFSISNKHSVLVFFWPIASSIEISVYLLSLGTLAVGFIFGFGFSWTVRLPIWFEQRKTQNQNIALQQEIKELKQKFLQEQEIQAKHISFSPPANA